MRYGRWFLILLLGLAVSTTRADEPVCEQCPEPGWLPSVTDRCQSCLHSVCDDFANCYTGDNLLLLGLGVAVAAPLANTHADEGFHAWYQGHVRSPRTDEWSAGAKVFGEHWYLIPVTLGAASLSLAFDETEPCGVVGAWGCRTLRGLAVGAPAVGILQIGLGASRPEDDNPGWHPFHSNHGVAGHGFVGAVPFLTAAAMTDNPYLKSAFFAGSFLTTWSRLNDDSHYLSQAVLGWWIAFLAVRSVDQTEMEKRRLLIAPGPCPDGSIGINCLFEF